MLDSKITAITPRFDVRDVTKAAEWYRDRLEFAVGNYFRPDGAEPLFVVVSRPPVAIQLMRRSVEAALKPRSVDMRLVGAYMYVKNIDRLFEHLKSFDDVTFIYELGDYAYSRREFGVLDPDGHYLGFAEEARRQWRKRLQRVE